MSIIIEPNSGLYLYLLLILGIILHLLLLFSKKRLFILLAAMPILIFAYLQSDISLAVGQILATAIFYRLYLKNLNK